MLVEVSDPYFGTKIILVASAMTLIAIYVLLISRTEIYQFFFELFVTVMRSPDINRGIVPPFNLTKYL